MYREINLQEQEWICKLLNVNFEGKKILGAQIAKSKVSCEQNYAFLSLKFQVNNNVEKYPCKVRIPIAMHAFQTKSAPIIFLLHVIDGLVSELEVFSADSSRLDANKIELGRVEYEVNENISS